uniref:Integrase catalytic domain-containing protein n=1 Tax=Fagus sylvatica TaxID=28930 RepID=A0A2N9G595_FAGSY
MVSEPTIMDPVANNPSPLLLLNNMSNLMSIKLDSMNYMLWKLQISAILDAYSMIEHLDGSTQQPRQFIITEDGDQNLESSFLDLEKEGQGITDLAPFNTVLLQYLPWLWDQPHLKKSGTGWKRSSLVQLEQMCSISSWNYKASKRGMSLSVPIFNESRIPEINSLLLEFLWINEELLHMILKGLPKEFAPFASAIRTRDDSISFEKLSVLLQTEEQSMAVASESFSNSALAMFVSNGHKPNNGFNSGPRLQQSTRLSYHNPSNPISQPSSQPGSYGKSERPTCQICWKIGHYAVDCYHRMDFAYQGKNPPTKLAAMASASNLHYTQSSETWLTDSGASDHITANASTLNSQTPYQGTEQVTVGNGQNLPIQSIVHKLCLDNNCSCHFDAHKLLIQDLPTGRLLYKGLSKDGVYPINSSQFCTSASSKTACFASSSAQKWELWHSRLGHPSAKVLHTIFPSLSSCNSLASNSVHSHCKHCLAGKMHQLPFSVSTNKVTAPFQLVHADLWGPAPSVSLNGFKFYLVLVDEYTKFTWVYLLTHKSDTFPIFKQFLALVKTQFQHSVQLFRTDCGGEFTSHEFNTFCADNGIIHQLSCPHTPQQNGVAERKHRHLIQCALALLSQSHLPISYWSYAVSTAAHLINKLPTPLLSNKSPWESLFHTKPTLTHLRAFGCQCFPLLTPYNKHKLQPKSVPCIFVGYPFHSKGYTCLDPSTHRFYTSRNVLFNENMFPGLSTSQQPNSLSQTSTFSPDSWLTTLLSLHSCTHSQVSSSASLDSNISDSTPASWSSPSDITPVMRSIYPNIQCHAYHYLLHLQLHQTSLYPLYLQIYPILTLNTAPSHPATSNINPPAPHITSNHPMQTRSKSGIFKPKLGYAALIDYKTTEPPSYKIAAQHPQWCTAMQEEFAALQQQGTWSLVLPPPHKNVVGCKWVYKLKHNSNGTIARYKARLVAKGFHQQQGVDYAETFSPVIKPPTVRLILSLAVSHNWPLQQLDVKNAFLHGTLKEEVYMAQPQGYVDSSHPHYVCKLHKSIYGLKQAPRAWFESFTTQLLHLGFIASTADSSLFIYHHHTVIAYLLLYVDDIVLTSNSTSFLDGLILQLRKVFDIKDLGPLHYFLGLQVSRTTDTLHVTQTKYASDLLVKHQMVASKPAKTPSSPNTRLSLHEGDLLSDPHGYRSLVGALHYLTFTRPDISFAVHQVCQYMAAPTTTHLSAAKRILRYIKGTLFHGIAFTPGPLTLSVYSDADWAGDPDDRRSTSGLLVYLGSNPITWSAKKQATVSRSSTESEYRALATASAEVCWLRTLLKDLGIYLSQPPILWCDNVSALAIASNPVFHARTKHIELADIFTKSLPTQRFLDLQRNLTVSVRPHSIEGG